MAKLDNSILESSDQDVHPSQESNNGCETEPTNISKVPQFNWDQCIFQGASCKEVNHHTRLRQKTHHLDVDETQSAKTLCPDDSKPEYFMEENKFKV